MADDDVTLFGKIKNKLLDSKQKWAEEGRLLTGKTAAHSQRLPPGQRRVENWPVLDLGMQPEIPLHAWRLFVDGEVENPMQCKWGEFTDLPKTALTTDIHCVTKWSKFDTTWTGVLVRDLFEMAGAQPGATHVMEHAEFGYTTNVPLDEYYKNAQKEIPMGRLGKPEELAFEAGAGRRAQRGQEGQRAAHGLFLISLKGMFEKRKGAGLELPERNVFLASEEEKPLPGGCEAA